MWFANPGWRESPNHAALAGAVGSSPIAFIAGVETASTNGTSVTSAAIDSTGANFLVAAIADYAGAAVGATPIDSKGNTWNPLTSFVDGSNLTRIRLYWSKPSAVGAAHTISYTQTTPSIAFAAFSNTNATPFGSEVGASGSSVSPAGGSITPGANNGLIISAFCGLGPLPITPDPSFTIIGTALASSVNNFAIGMSYFIQTTAAAVNPVWTTSNSNPWAATNAIFKN